MIAWFAIVFTGHYPRGLYDFIAGYTRFITRVTAYGALLCDPYPSFGGSADPAYPVRMEFAPLEHYNRLKTLFRIILAIPIVILRYIIGLLLEVGAFAAWFVILFTGQDAARPVRPDGVRQLLHRALRRLHLPADRDLPAVRGDQVTRTTAPRGTAPELPVGS